MVALCLFCMGNGTFQSFRSLFLTIVFFQNDGKRKLEEYLRKEV